MAVYKPLIFVLPLVALCENGRIPPSVLEPLAIGTGTGFISDSPDVMNCGMGLMGEVPDLKSAAQDLANGIKSLNVTEIEASLNEFQAAIEGAQVAEESCKAVKADAKNLIKSIKQVPHQPKDFVIHIVSNLFDDADMIFSELAASEKAYKTGWDYMTAGTNLGMALRRMLVGEMNGTKPLPPMPKDVAEQVVIGMTMGFISDSPNDVMACGMQVAGEAMYLKDAVDDLKKGMKTMNVTEIEEAIGQVKAAIDGSDAAKKECNVVGGDVAAVVQALKKIHGPRDLIIHIVENVFDDGEPIFSGLAAASRAYKTGWDFNTAGTELGKVFRRMLVGEIVFPNTTSTASVDIVV